ncbi:kinase-like domain-containing protein [Aspergillus bertholletiae]|uniref:non-specific serine/threonine protein kinase n=1 Tax=Aspergillus bertholletiae TaxID=1226010 RepID=A0A5N7BBZ8_9EURO|nr:kinase-like domain-containing protein [Aspergillus bertholletiae]
MMSRLQNSYGTCTTHQHQLKLELPEHKPGLKLLSTWTFSNVLAGCWSPKESADDEERQALLTPSSTAPSTLTERYGLSTNILHYGVHSSVRVYARKPSSAGASKQLHVVKIFRPSSDAHVRATQRFEQSLSLAVSHPNLLQTIDVLRNEHRETCLVMDYCAGGNLSTLISTTEDHIDARQADCFFKQIMRAVTYLHDNAIAHCGLRTENILLTAHGAVKVADFGSAEWLLDEVTDMEQAENRIRLQLSSLYSPRKVRGSIPYLAPEEFSNSAAVDPRAGDIWSAGLVYMAMRCGRLLWKIPCADEDGGYNMYLRGRQTYDGYPPIEALEQTRCRNVIYAMLHPDPVRRLKASQVLRSEWVYYVKVCDAGKMGW